MPQPCPCPAGQRRLVPVRTSGIAGRVAFSGDRRRIGSPSVINKRGGAHKSAPDRVMRSGANWVPSKRRCARCQRLCRRVGSTQGNAPSAGTHACPVPADSARAPRCRHAADTERLDGIKSVLLDSWLGAGVEATGQRAVMLVVGEVRCWYSGLVCECLSGPGIAHATCPSVGTAGTAVDT